MKAALYRWCMVNAGSMLVAILSILLIIPSAAIGQDKKSGGGGESTASQIKLETVQEHLEEQKGQRSSPTLDPVMSGVDLKSLSGEYTIYEYDQMWNRNPNPNPEWDFRLFEQGEPAGDINGDNKDDFIVSDSLYQKTAVFFGGNNPDPDQIIERELKPVGDINGDGYADAVAVDILSHHYIYEGTESGYNQTNSTLNDLDPQNHVILGFVDLNQDGREDIFAYSNTTGEVKITLGQINFGDMLIELYSGIFSLSPKKVAVKDIDQDSLVEIVEFRGILGDGQIQVFEFNDLSFILDSNFAFTPAFDDASNTDLHLIDINGDGYDEIYISLGRKSPKYVFEYDDGGYSTSPIEILDGSLVPAGDLNGDGNHDFIMGDPDDSYSPHIAYGPDDLKNTSLKLDVALSGDNANWNWEMAYNPYSSFGDLNGDGIDDAVLFHTKRLENGINYGRRILLDNDTDEDLISDNSEFQLYPGDYFYNLIYEVEELGDVNGDGVDDFAIVLHDQGKVEIYYGGSSISESPDQSLSSGYTLDAVTRGDFTGDGINDIVALSWGLNGYQIEVFEGGRSFNRIKSIAISDFQNAEVHVALGVNNIGDINGNGSSDFLVGSGSARDTTEGDHYLNEAYVFHGGESISSSPDNTIDIDPTNDFFSIYLSAAESATSLGDLDGDGLGDFAVGSPLKGNGEVNVYLSDSNEPIHLMPSTGTWFGSDIVSGDFNGDGLKDLSVSVTSTDTVSHIYYGKEDFGTAPDKSLLIPDFFSENTMLASLETIPDFNNDGKDELVVGSSGFFNNNAALYADIENNSSSARLIKGANPDAALGGNNFINKYGTMATGDFTDNGELDLVISQFNDNSDGINTSRVYRYALSLPITITSVEDVPEDHGGAVRVNIGGELLESTSGYDSLGVQRMTPDNEWKTIVTDTNPGAGSYDVSVPKTQPAHNEEVDNSYTFRVVAFTNTVFAKSQEVTGRAFDNIPPQQVQNVSLEEQERSKVLSWQEVDAPDVGTYLIFTVDADGHLSEIPMDSTDGNNFILPDHFEGVQTFAVAAWDVNNNEGEVSTPVNAIYPQTAEYATEEGWNLIGLPVEANADSIQSLLQDPDLTIYEYDGGYKQVNQLEAGKGYWAKFSDVTKRTLKGFPFTEFSVNLKEGWNLVSGVGAEMPVESIEDPDEIIIAGTAYTFDQAYLASDTLRPALGYWIRTDAAGTVTFTHPKLHQNQREANEKTKNSLAKTSEEVIKEFNKVVISDGSNSTELFFGGQLPHEVNRLRYSLPPLPPGEFFDVRYEGDTRLVEKHEVNIQLNKIEETPLTLKINARHMAEQNEFVVKEFADGKLRAEYKVNASEEISLKHKDTDSIYLAPDDLAQMSQGIPDKFNLDQNYPNPFNPITQIQYSVPEATEVKLEIFNILGRRIRTLINEHKEPGNYEVTFNGSDLASGLYLYRLQAGDFISTKKFILAK